MNENETVIDGWRSLDGAPVGRGNKDADVVFAHVSDLHGQLTPRYQVYYDNPTSGPTMNFGEDDESSSVGVECRFWQRNSTNSARTTTSVR
jgi:sulfur-oxidizing protein SoxB